MMNPSTCLQSALDAHAAGRSEDAANHLLDLLRSEPKLADALHLLGLLQADAGDLTTAEGLVRSAIAVRDEAVFRSNLDRLLSRVQRGRKSGPQAACDRARKLQVLGQLDQADGAYAAILAEHPQFVPALWGHASVLHDLRRHGEAEALSRRALEIDDSVAGCWITLGLALHGQAVRLLAQADQRQQADALIVEARDAYRRGIDLGWDRGDIPFVGALHIQLGELAAAEALFRDVITRSPTHRASHLNLGLVLLAQGRLEEGWAHFKWRRTLPATRSALLKSLPEWEGDPLAGRSILLQHEQGLGDAIQFARYAAVLKRMGAGSITVAAPRSLASVIETAPGIDKVIGQRPNAKVEADCWALIMDLPRLVGTTAQTIPAELPYIRASQKKIGAWLPRLPATRPRVGLVWRGSAKHGNDAHRSLPGLETLAPLWQVEGVSFVSLQRDAGALEARTPPAGQPLVHLGEDFEDFADTAAVVDQLDLVICVDTSIAHLAGAMGKPVWVLIPALEPDWRWMRDREDSPWYPGIMKLYRQQAPGMWDEAIARVARDLTLWARALAGESPKRTRKRAQK